jgi:hypothetical protein
MVLVPLPLSLMHHHCVVSQGVFDDDFVANKQNSLLDVEFPTSSPLSNRQAWFDVVVPMFVEDKVNLHTCAKILLDIVKHPSKMDFLEAAMDYLATPLCKFISFMAMWLLEGPGNKQYVSHITSDNMATNWVVDVMMRCVDVNLRPLFVPNSLLLTYEQYYVEKMYADISNTPAFILYSRAPAMMYFDADNAKDRLLKLCSKVHLNVDDLLDVSSFGGRMEAGICGGLAAYCQFVKPWRKGDMDVFLVGEAAACLEFVQCKIAFLTALPHTRKCVVQYGNVVDCHLKTQATELKIQFILREHHNWESVLSGFDLPPCAIMYRNGGFLALPKAWEALRTKLCLLDPTLCKSPSSLSRIMKYMARSFNMVCPTNKYLQQQCEDVWMGRLECQPGDMMKGINIGHVLHAAKSGGHTPNKRNTNPNDPLYRCWHEDPWKLWDLVTRRRALQHQDVLFWMDSDLPGADGMAAWRKWDITAKWMPARHGVPTVLGMGNAAVMNVNDAPINAVRGFYTLNIV